MSAWRTYEQVSQPQADSTATEDLHKEKPQQTIDTITSTENLWFWSYFDGNSTITSLIIAETREEAYEIAIKKRMEWSKMNRAGAEKWFKDLDWLEKVTNHQILES